MTVGVDVGGRKIAIVCPERDVYFAYEVKKIDYETFYRLAYGHARRHAIMLRDEVWFMEEPVVAGARNIQSTIKVAKTAGLVHAAVRNIQGTAVSSWKKSTVGNGNANKSQVREWLETHHPDIARKCRGNQDLIDAACISLHGHTTLE